MNHQLFMNKLELIKQFNKYHPAWGVDWGYSTYVGGMADTGNWIWEKLMSEPEQVLKVRLDILKRKKKESDKYNKERLKENERISALPEDERDEIYRKQRQEIADQFKKLMEEKEAYLMWGKK